MLVARESMAPERRVRKISTMAEAVRKRERSAKMGPAGWLVRCASSRKCDLVGVYRTSCHDGHVVVVAARFTECLFRRWWWGGGGVTRLGVSEG
jgi:transposase